MHELGLVPGRPYKKSATVVGDVLGKYHPHGDVAVYDSLVRMVQDFSLRYPLVDGQGNFGSVDGDPPAAYRYTEARLTRIAMTMLEDIDKNTVDFVPNFDDRLQEPTVLPARLPNLIVNGTSGIAVGMATNIPPHNLAETVEAINHLVDHSDASIKDLRKFIKGPDFPTGAIIYGREGIKECYEKVRGRMVLRARGVVEEKESAGNQQIVDGAGPEHHPPATLLVALLDPLAAVDDRARREVRPLDELPEILEGRVRVVDQMVDRLNRLRQVVRRDVGRHPHRDARRAVHDQVGEPRRQHRRLLQPVVEVGDEVDGILVDVLEHRHRDAGEAGFRVAIGGRRIAVYRAEVPLAIHQRIAQREILDHPHQRVVHRHIAVRVILAEHVADDCGALFIGAPGHEPQLVHGVQDAAVHGLEPIAHVGERALHDHAHRVVEERLAHLVFDEAREDAFAGRCGHETKCQVLNVGCQQGSARLPKLLKNNHLGLERQRETGR